MDTLHTVLRSLRGETKSSRGDHIKIFREFIHQLDRAAATKKRSSRAQKAGKSKSKPRRKR